MDGSASTVDELPGAILDVGDPWPTDGGPGERPPAVVRARLLVGWVVLVGAEVLSGASLGMGLWHPWTLLLTYWLYFCHFFLFTTLSIRTGRTSLGSLYLWGVLYGLYESWITKVIWYGFNGDGRLQMGKIGPYGLAEITMVFFFHPILSFIVPLAVACLLWPPLLRIYPDLGPYLRRTRRAGAVRACLVMSFAPIVAMNGGGPLNIALNSLFLVIVFLVLGRLARPARIRSDGRAILEFGRPGLVGLCIYLAVLYTLTYFGIRPEGLPSGRVQWGTLALYGLAILGLWLQQRRSPTTAAIDVDPRSLRTAEATLATILGLGLVLSLAPGNPLIVAPAIISFAAWIALSAILPLVVLGRAIQARWSTRP
ncbi:hypothetical protein [Aquisphaera insulae]|uniref:hypothetical protein n=1 Tax=Aquisphaera insulae TaxID=2712864 RepID=UPI0013EC18DD|nr:hypothetical protein [Aquisphaera insulae]